MSEEQQSSPKKFVEKTQLDHDLEQLENLKIGLMFGQYGPDIDSDKCIEYVFEGYLDDEE